MHNNNAKIIGSPRDERNNEIHIKYPHLFSLHSLAHPLNYKSPRGARLEKSAAGRTPACAF